MFSNREDYDFALTKDKKYIGKRYVEVNLFFFRWLTLIHHYCECVSVLLAYFFC